MKNTISAFPLYLRTAHVLEVGTFIFMLQTHLHSLQETSTQRLCGSCWHLFALLVYTAGLVTIDILIEGSLKRTQQQLQVRIVSDHSVLLSLEITVSENV